jgi:hypothetical protein
LITIITVVALALLSLFLIFSDQLVGKAYTAGQVNAGFKDIPTVASDTGFTLDVWADVGSAETVAISFKVDLPTSEDCNNMVSSSSVALGWSDTVDNAFFCHPSFDNELWFIYSTTDFSLAKSGEFKIAEITFAGLPAVGSYDFEFKSFNIVDMNDPTGSLLISSGESTTVEVQDIVVECTALWQEGCTQDGAGYECLIHQNTPTGLCVPTACETSFLAMEQSYLTNDANNNVCEVDGSCMATGETCHQLYGDKKAVCMPDNLVPDALTDCTGIPNFCVYKEDWTGDRCADGEGPCDSGSQCESDDCDLTTNTCAATPVGPCALEADCSSPTPYCGPLGECVGCVSDTHCAGEISSIGNTLFCGPEATCIECVDDTPCADPLPLCGENNLCVAITCGTTVGEQCTADGTGAGALSCYKPQGEIVGTCMTLACNDAKITFDNDWSTVQAASTETCILDADCTGVDELCWQGRCMFQAQSTQLDMDVSTVVMECVGTVGFCDFKRTWTNALCADGEGECDAGDLCESNYCDPGTNTCATASVETECNDDQDNDGDTFVDCADTDCAASDDCKPCSNTLIWESCGLNGSVHMCLFDRCATQECYDVVMSMVDTVVSCSDTVSCPAGSYCLGDMCFTETLRNGIVDNCLGVEPYCELKGVSHGKCTDGEGGCTDDAQCAGGTCTGTNSGWDPSIEACKATAEIQIEVLDATGAALAKDANVYTGTTYTIRITVTPESPIIIGHLLLASVSYGNNIVTEFADFKDPVDNSEIIEFTHTVPDVAGETMKIVAYGWNGWPTDSQPFDVLLSGTEVDHYVVSTQ